MPTPEAGLRRSMDGWWWWTRTFLHRNPWSKKNWMIHLSPPRLKEDATRGKWLGAGDEALVGEQRFLPMGRGKFKAKPTGRRNFSTPEELGKTRFGFGFACILPFGIWIASSWFLFGTFRTTALLHFLCLVLFDLSCSIAWCCCYSSSSSFTFW